MIADSVPKQPAGLAILTQIEQEVATCKLSLQNIQPPGREHESALADITQKIDESWSFILGNPVDAAQHGKTKEMEGLLEKKAQLEAIIKAASKDQGKQAAYAQNTNKTVQSLMDKLKEIFKESRLNNVEMISNTEPVDLTLNDAPAVEPTQRSRARIRTGGATITSNRETRKRKRVEGFQNGQKRTRFESTRNSVHFDAVFQDGKAPKKQIIVRRPADTTRPGRFYIIRCEKHNLCFEDNPLQSASTHLQRKHKASRAGFDTVIELMGYEVIGCDEEQVEKNNAVARESFEKGEEFPAGDSIRVREGSSDSDTPPPESSRGRGQDARNRRSTRGSKRHSDQHPDSRVATDPVPGNIYIVYWPESKQWYAGMLLPLQDLESIGIHCTVEKLGLLQSVPDCYQYDSSSMSFSWAKGYEKGGPKAGHIEFAFMFFEGVKFPEESHVAWVPKDDIQEWDENKALLIEHSQQAIEYLKDREKEKPRTLGLNEAIRDSADDGKCRSQFERLPLTKADCKDMVYGSELQVTRPTTLPAILPDTFPEISTGKELSQVPEPVVANDVEAPKVTEESEEVSKTGEDGGDDFEPPVQMSDLTDDFGQEYNGPVHGDTTEDEIQQEGPEQNDSEPEELEEPKTPEEPEEPKEPSKPEELEELEEPKPTREPRRDRLSTVDINSLFELGESLDEHISASEKRQSVDDQPVSSNVANPPVSQPPISNKPPVPSATEATHLAQMAYDRISQSQDESQVQRPPVPTHSPRDETSRERPRYSDMGQRASTRPHNPSTSTNFPKPKDPLSTPDILDEHNARLSRRSYQHKMKLDDSQPAPKSSAEYPGHVQRTYFAEALTNRNSSTATTATSKCPSASHRSHQASAITEHGIIAATIREEHFSTWFGSLRAIIITGYAIATTSGDGNFSTQHCVQHASRSHERRIATSNNSGTPQTQQQHDQPEFIHWHVTTHPSNRRV
ncbi:hypothetical protein NW762_014222 [Fusarium torreyae]|uniref:Uncharacterized protein n=1 Tax=Fusarium torreyae TaxID=1237075 RepID=A0A9W8RKD6_9HYPO|nr:hypothetical protein NW762_014222 [Fusarium torreyae]